MFSEESTPGALSAEPEVEVGGFGILEPVPQVRINPACGFVTGWITRQVVRG